MRFTQTSDKPYTRHNYKVVKSNGDSVVFDNWEDAQQLWWNSPSGFLSHVEVLDDPQTIQKKGFSK